MGKPLPQKHQMTAFRSLEGRFAHGQNARVKKDRVLTQVRFLTHIFLNHFIITKTPKEGKAVARSLRFMLLGMVLALVAGCGYNVMQQNEEAVKAAWGMSRPRIRGEATSSRTSSRPSRPMPSSNRTL